MLTSLNVINFRNLKSTRLDQVGRITLIGGKNGVGKTALLEALWLLSGPDIPELGTRVSTFRGLPVLGPGALFNDVFRNLDPEQRIRISAHGDWGNQARVLDIHLQPRQQSTAIPAITLGKSTIEGVTLPQREGDVEIVFTYKHNNGRKYTSRAWWVASQLTPELPGSPINIQGEGLVQERQAVPNRPTSVFIPAIHRDNHQAIAERLGRLQLLGVEDKLLQFIRPLEPRIRSLIPITIKGTPLIHAYLEGFNRPIPVQLLGEGLNRMLALVLSMSEAEGGLLLVDEIENGLHHSVHEDVFSILIDLAESFDIQIFATTHSHECISAAFSALGKRHSEQFTYYRMDRIDGSAQATKFDNEMIETAIAHDLGIR